MQHPLVFKFGGASVADAASVRNLARIVISAQRPLVVVVSAMGKTTNLLERLVACALAGAHGQVSEIFEQFRAFHLQVAQCLVPDSDDVLFGELNREFVRVYDWLGRAGEPGITSGQLSDQVVAAGEWLSTRIVARFLNCEGIRCAWLDAGDFIITADNYREASVNWEITEMLVKKYVDFSDYQVFVTQGFVGKNTHGFRTTLGREGSDYTAAILASILDAPQVVLWKDVPGVFNADPKRVPDALPLPRLSWQEAVELTFFGAKVIHPKTIKPLQNKGIPLIVKSFYDPSQPGTRIDEGGDWQFLPPVLIHQPEQILISCVPKDYSFVAENHLSRIFGLFAAFRVKVNLMQHSAISFSVCSLHEPDKIELLLEQLRADFVLKYNTDLELVTIRHYNQSVLDSFLSGRRVFLEQRSRSTVQLVLAADAAAIAG